MKKDVIFLAGLLLLLLLCWGIIFSVAAQGYQYNSDPHGTQAECGPHAKSNCACPKIVSDIQVEASKKCHEEFLEPKQVLACLGKIPSHCDIMRDGHAMPQYDKYLRDKNKVLKMCSTQCYHKKCKCGDQVCTERKDVD